MVNMKADFAETGVHFSSGMKWSPASTVSCIVSTFLPQL